MNKIIYKIIAWIFFKALNFLYNYIDKDKNGELSKEEIQHVIQELETKLKSLKKKK
jgi:predicted AlkP superfamily phosphohydrolase/phosphomutase